MEKEIETQTDSLENFDKMNNVPPESGAHSTRDQVRRIHTKSSNNWQSLVCSVTPGRRHNSLANLKTDYIRSLSESKLKEWKSDHYVFVLLESKI